MLLIERSKYNELKEKNIMLLSENLKKYRILKDLTQEDVAIYLGITSQSVSKWERGVSQTKGY